MYNEHIVDAIIAEQMATGLGASPTPSTPASRQPAVLAPEGSDRPISGHAVAFNADECESLAGSDGEILDPGTGANGVDSDSDTDCEVIG